MFKEHEENTLFNYLQITSGAQDRSHVECLWSATVGSSEFAGGMDSTVELQQGFRSCVQEVLTEDAGWYVASLGVLVLHLGRVLTEV